MERTVSQLDVSVHTERPRAEKDSEDITWIY